MFNNRPKQIGSYIIDREIAKSGCAVVYLGHHEEQPKIQVAVKVAYTDSRMDEGGRQMFFDLIKREARILEKLYHPGILTIHPLFSPNTKGAVYYERALNLDDRPWYFVMEYLGKNNLKEHMKTIQRFPIEWKMELFYQILQVLDYLHEKGHAHCDLKPENIFLRGKPTANEVPQPVLIDFGTASRIDYLDNEPAVSLPYASIEAMRLRYGGNRMDVYPDSMDVWSLGAIFFELVTGEPILPRHLSEKDTLTQIENRMLPMISDKLKNVSTSIDRYLDAMLQPAPENRPTTRELMVALNERIAPPPRVIGRL